MAKKIISVFMMILTLFYLTGCSKQLSKEEIAEGFITRVLTAPDEKIQNWLILI